MTRILLSLLLFVSAVHAEDISTSPASYGVAITPNDDAELSDARALWVGTGGTLVVRTVAGKTITLTNVPDGALLPIAVDKVLATGTTCSGIVALW